MIRLDKARNDAERAGLVFDDFRLKYNYHSQAHHPKWKMALAFYLGKQWVKWHSSPMGYSGLKVVKPNAETERISVDKFSQLITGVGETIYQESPSAVHIPVTAQPSDIGAAQSSDHFNEFLWRENEIPSLYEQLALIVPLWGTGFWCSRWDKDWGEEMAYNVEEEMGAAVARGESVARWEKLLGDAKEATGEKGDGMLRYSWGKPGDSVEMPQMILLNFGATADRKTWTDYTLAKLVPLEWFEENFPGKEVAPSAEFGQWKFISPVSGLGTQKVMPHSPTDEWALYLEWHMRGNKQHPKGLTILCGGENAAFLRQSEGDHPDGELGLYAAWWQRNPMSAYGVGLGEKLIQPQVEYNIARSQVAEWRLRMMGKWIAAQNSGIPSTITNDPHEVIMYTLRSLEGKHEPLKAVAPPAPPPFLMESVAMAERDMQDMASYHTPSLQAGQPRVRSGLQLDLHAENDVRGRWSVTKGLKNLEVWHTKRRLKLAKENWPVPVKIRIVGEGNEVAVEDFDAANTPEAMDVQVRDAGPTLLNRQLQERKMLDRFMAGLFGPVDPRHPEYPMSIAALAKALGVPRDDFPNLEVTQAINQARKETRAILLHGQSQPVYRWHKHPLHMAGHFGEANDQKYQEAPEENLALFEQHLQGHDEFMPETYEGRIQQLQQEQTQMTQQAQALQEELTVRDKEADVREEYAREIAMAEVGVGENI